MKNKKLPDWAAKALRIIKKNQYVLIVLFVGLIILLIPGGSSDKEESADTAAAETTQSSDFDLERQEEKVAQALSQIQGAGKVTVVLTLKTTMEQEVQVDADKDGGQETVIVSTGTGTESPVTVKYIYPEYKGALIVSEGADNAAIQLQITEAVASLTGLGTDKISVIKMKD